MSYFNMKTGFSNSVSRIGAAPCRATPASQIATLRYAAATDRHAMLSAFQPMFSVRSRKLHFNGAEAPRSPQCRFLL
jgi:hypothetical protein